MPLGRSYRRSRYKEYSNKDKLASATRRHEKALKHKKALLSQSKIGRPSFSGPSTVEKGEAERRLRSNTGLFNSKLCIRQEPGGRLYNVEFKEAGKSMLYVAEKHRNTVITEL